MANFRLTAGTWVRVIKELEAIKGDTLERGSEVQVLGFPPHGSEYVTFVGIYGYYSLKNLGNYIEPIIEEVKH
jgi:hypothetical protein